MGKTLTPNSRMTIMLVLTRRVDETITIGPNITIMLVAIQGDQVRIGIKAPKNVPICRHNAKIKTRQPR